MGPRVYRWGMAVHEVELLAHQLELVLDETSSAVVLSGGFGAGKTFGLVAKVCQLGALNWPTAGLVIEPTYPMVRDILVPTFRDCFTAWGVPWRYHKTDHILTVNVGTARPFDVYLRSGDEPDRIIGFNAGWGAMDEHEKQTHEVWKMLNARVRDKRSKCPQLFATGTAEGYGWAYKMFEKEPLLGSRVIRAQTRDNPHNADGYEARMRANLSDAEALMYLEGIRTKREGRVYGRFDRNRHVVAAQSIRGEHFVGADFNVRKMAWCFATKTGERMHVWGELVREDTDTMAQADEAKVVLARAYSQAYGKAFTPDQAAAMTTIVCDAAGNSASTSSKQSDVMILIGRGFKVKYPSANPFIEDRVLAVNVMLEEQRLLVDARADYTIQCLEQQGYGKDGKPAKAQNAKEGLDHGADAVGYLTFWHWPAWKPKANDPRAGRGKRSPDGSWSPT